MTRFLAFLLPLCAAAAAPAQGLHPGAEVVLGSATNTIGAALSLRLGHAELFLGTGYHFESGSRAELPLHAGARLFSGDGQGLMLVAHALYSRGFDGGIGRRLVAGLDAGYRARRDHAFIEAFAGPAIQHDYEQPYLKTAPSTRLATLPEVGVGFGVEL